MSLHSEETGISIHIINSFTYADVTARLNATGLTSADIGKVAKQLDDNSFWVLINHSPISWKELTGGSGPHAMGGAEHTPDTLANINSKINDATLIDTNDSRLSDSRSPSGNAGGDLGGTYPNPTITGFLKHIKYEKDLPLSSTSSATFQDKLSLITGALTGDFYLQWFAAMNSSGNQCHAEIRLYNDTDSQVIGKAQFWYDTVGGLSKPYGGITIISLNGTSKTFKIQYRDNNNPSQTANIQDAVMVLWRLT